MSEQSTDEIEVSLSPREWAVIVASVRRVRDEFRPIGDVVVSIVLARLMRQLDLTEPANA